MRWFNYIKVALRTLILHRRFSLLTLIGMSVGIAMGLLVLQYVFYQFSFDTYYSNPGDIYRVTSTGHLSSEELGAAVVPVILGPTLEKYSQVEVLTRVVPAPEMLVKSPFNEAYQTEVVFADRHFFEVFDRPFLLGDSAACFPDSACAIISSSAASRFFGQNNPLGQTIQLDDSTTFTVKAVFEDVPPNSHFKYSIVLPFSFVLNRMKVRHGDDYQKTVNSWFTLSGYAYFRKSAGANMDSLRHQFNADADLLMEPEIMETFGSKTRANLDFRFQPLRHIYLFSDLDFEIGATTNAVYVFLFLAVALFILGITAVNFINLTMARATIRFKEVGVRRVFGARRTHIVFQFFTESVVFTFMALFLGLVLVELSMPSFNRLFQIQLKVPGYRDQMSILWILANIFFVALLSGSYPALYFSGIHPRTIFRGVAVRKKKSVSLRGFLVMLQVFVAVSVITIALGMQRQLGYIHHADLGFDTGGLYIIERTGVLADKTDSVIDALKKVDGVEQMVKLYRKPGENIPLISFYHADDTSRAFLLGVQYVDCHLFEAIGVDVISGQSPGKGDCADSTRVLINQTGARLLNIGEVAGEYIKTVSRSGEHERLEIAGVVPDVHFESLKQPLRPTIFVPVTSKEEAQNLLVKFNRTDIEGVEAKMMPVWRHYAGDAPFVVSPVAARIAAFYDEDTRYSNIATSFAVLALFIAALGLIGMSSFILGFRQNEMILRKVSGAPVPAILGHIFRGYFMYVLLGVLLSISVSNVFLKMWLSTYTYNFGLNLFCFLIPAILVSAIALIIAWSTGVSTLQNVLKHIREITR